MLTALACLLAPAACTNVALRCNSAECEPLYAAPADNQMALEGETCTASPNSVGYPYKILFIVDVSGSTATSDPTKNRGPAVEAAIEQYATNPEVSFAILSFDTQPHSLEPIFTNDLNILLPIIPQLTLDLDDTDYVDTLALAQQVIAADANQYDAVQRSRIRYDIQWLSDGVPNPCVTIDQILADEEQILNLQKSMGLFSITLSTVFLTGAPGGDNCAQTADQIMQPMAQTGGGTYQALTGPNIHFNIDFDSILEPFSKQMFYVVNHSRVVQNGVLYPDSDQDGVSDADEIANGTDPTNPATGPSGCSDRIAYLTSVNPNMCASMCTTAAQDNNGILMDTDAEGLKDCEELAMSTDRTKGDTDGDNFIDSLETRFGTNASDAATLTEDTDFDGTTDGMEILTGTDPLTAEPNRTMAYSYSPLAAVSNANAPTGETCYNFEVRNIQMVQTIATPTSQAGDNVICAYMEQRPTDTSSGDTEVTVSRACVTANYQVTSNGSVKIPASGTVIFQPSDFQPYICGSLPCGAD